MKATAIGWLVLVLAAAAPFPAQARDDDDEDEAAEEESASEGDEDSDDEAEEGDGEDSDDEADDEDSDEGDEAEAEGQGEGDNPSVIRSWYFGPFLRYSILPAFMIEIGMDAAPTAANAAFGIAANHRNPDGASFELGLGYTGLSFHGPMRASGDPPEDTEWVDSSLGLLHATASIYWTARMLDKLSFEYGLGLDFGFMLGELKRTEAYPSGGGYARCLGPINAPLSNSTYCANPPVAYDKDGEHYGVVEKRIPPVAGSLMLPHLALRYEPIPEVAVKLEGALGFPIFFIGLSAAYAPEL
jgi:hypothetical protein